jgi:rhodanese-related sulfurtransferase
MIFRMRELIQKMTLILTVAAGLALLVNGLSPHGIPLIGQWNAEVGVVTADTDAAALWMDFELSSPQVAKQVFDAGEALFVDVRSRDMFAAGHIPGAVSLPFGDFDTMGDAFAADISPQKPIVTYCSGRLCQDSLTVAQLLMERGFENVVVYIDGFPGWIENGYPVATP